MTVVFALLGMVIVPTSIFFSIGLGAILVVVVAVLAALTLVPAILSLLDNRINSLRVPFMCWTSAKRDGFGKREIRLI